MLETIVDSINTLNTSLPLVETINEYFENVGNNLGINSMFLKGWILGLGFSSAYLFLRPDFYIRKFKKKTGIKLPKDFGENKGILGIYEIDNASSKENLDYIIWHKNKVVKGKVIKDPLEYNGKIIYDIDNNRKTETAKEYDGEFHDIKVKLVKRNIGNYTNKQEQKIYDAFFKYNSAKEAAKKLKFTTANTISKRWKEAGYK